jgi:hypothetical protein
VTLEFGKDQPAPEYQSSKMSDPLLMERAFHERLLNASEWSEAEIC